MWYVINWLCAFCMTLFFQKNTGIWYGGKYINSFVKPKEELEEFKRGIQTSGNLLQSYRDLYSPIFSHQHSTLIKYPLLQQTDKIDFNYYNRHLTARENKFQHFPPYNFGIGKNPDTYYVTKFLLPNYKVLINPFFPRINTPSKYVVNAIGDTLANQRPLEPESEYVVNAIGGTLANQRPLEPEMKYKGTRESQYYSYGVKKRKPTHEKKNDENDKLFYSSKGVGGLFLPSKIILDNISAWKWKNKKEIQTNNLSMSMVYDLLLPKSMAHKAENNPQTLCLTTKKVKNDNIYDTSLRHQCISPTKEMLATSICLTATERVMHFNNKTQLNACSHQEECRCDNGIHRCEKCGKYKKTMCCDNELKNIMASTCFIDCGCRTKYQNQTASDCLTSPAITTEVPVIFKFEDYICECYSTATNTHVPVKRRKIKRKKNNGKEKIKSLKSKVPEIDLKIHNEGNDFQTDKERVSNDDLNIAKYIIISNDGVIGSQNDESFIFDFENISSLNTNSFNFNGCSTKISRNKRRTFGCKSMWDSKRKRAFVPINSYHSCLFQKPRANFITTPIATHLKNRNLRIRKMKKYRNKQLEKKQKNIFHKGLNWRVFKNHVDIKQSPNVIDVIADNEKNKEYKKREFIGERQSINSTDPCDDYEEISISMKPPSVKTTLLITDTENPTHSIFVKSSPIISKPTKLISIDKTTPYTFHIFEKSSKIKSMEMPTGLGHNPTHSTFIELPAIHSETTKLISTNKITSYSSHLFERSTEIIPMPTDIGPKLRPDTGNLHPAKLKCEQQYNRDCICSVTKFLDEVNILISHNEDRKFLLNQLTKYECTFYDPVEITYKMSPELKPRLISKKHKELLADERNGPKEIISETFQELLTRDMPNEETDFYIFPSSNVEIPCFINDDVQLSPNTADSASYVWRQGDNRIITGGRVTEDLNHRGMLQIAGATIADSDNYTCTVNYTNPDTGRTVIDSFVHSVMVVTLPKFALHTLLHYTAKVKCDQETLEMFELYLPQQVEDYICYIKPDRRKICSIEIHNPICHPKNNENVDLKSVWKFSSKGIKQNPVAFQENAENTMELSQNFELDIADVTQTMISTANHTRCGPFCQLKIILKVVDILRESFTIVLTHPVISPAGATFKPDVNSINMKILIACEGGFKLIQGFCMPCPANTYSEEGSTECSQCPSGTYQPNIGSRTCQTCPHPFRTGCSSLWLSPAVIAVTILIILLTILISTIAVYFCKFCVVLQQYTHHIADSWIALRLNNVPMLSVCKPS